LFKFVHDDNDFKVLVFNEMPTMLKSFGDKNLDDDVVSFFKDSTAAGKVTGEGIFFDDEHRRVADKFVSSRMVVYVILANGKQHGMEFAVRRRLDERVATERKAQIGHSIQECYARVQNFTSEEKAYMRKVQMEFQSTNARKMLIFYQMYLTYCPQVSMDCYNIVWPRLRSVLKKYGMTVDTTVTERIGMIIRYVHVFCC